MWLYSAQFYLPVPLKIPQPLFQIFLVSQMILQLHYSYLLKISVVAIIRYPCILVTVYEVTWYFAVTCSTLDMAKSIFVSATQFWRNPYQEWNTWLQNIMSLHRLSPRYMDIWLSQQHWFSADRNSAAAKSSEKQERSRTKVEGFWGILAGRIGHCTTTQIEFQEWT